MAIDPHLETLLRRRNASGTFEIWPEEVHSEFLAKLDLRVGTHDIPVSKPSVCKLAHAPLREAMKHLEGFFRSPMAELALISVL